MTLLAAPRRAAGGGAEASGGGARHRELASLTGLRAAAAFAVFAFHTRGYGDSATGWWHLSDIGFVGVSFFFVLSGVVLVWADAGGVPRSNFFLKRFARIYPSHLVMATVAAVVYLAWFHLHQPLWAVALTFVLLQAWVPSETAHGAGNGVSWSLSCEAFFYACFPWLSDRLAHLRPSRRLLVTAALAAATVGAGAVGSFAAGGRHDVVISEMPVVRIGEFVAGVTLGLALRAGWQPRWGVRPAWAAVAVGAGVPLLLARLHDRPVPRGFADALLLLPFVALLAAYAARDLRRQGSWFARPTLTYLGRISFAFYLVHQVAQGVVVRVGIGSGSTVGQTLARSGTSLAVALVTAVALHHLVELPWQRRIMARHGRSRPSPAPAYPSVGFDRGADGLAGAGRRR